MRRERLKTRRRPGEKAPLTRKPSGVGLVLGAVFDGMLASSMVARLRELHSDLTNGHHNAHALLWELRRAYEFARKYPGVAAGLVFVLCSEFMPYVASRMEIPSRPPLGEAYSPLGAIERKPCGQWHAALEACNECDA